MSTMVTINDKTTPIEAVHPTELIIDEIKERGISRRDMAIRLGMQPSNFSRMIKQKETITPQMAYKLEDALGIPSSMWLNLQADYDKDIITISQRNRTEEEWSSVEKMLAGLINIALLFKQLGADGYSFAKDRIKFLYEKLSVSSADEILLLSQPSGYFKRSDKIAVEEKNLKAWVLLAYSACVNKKINQGFTRESVFDIARDISDQANKGIITEEYIEHILAVNGIGYSYVP